MIRGIVAGKLKELEEARKKEANSVFLGLRQKIKEENEKDESMGIAWPASDNETKLTIIVMPEVEPLPTMDAYISIDRNVWSEDTSELAYIPPFEHLEGYTEFVKDLKSMYETARCDQFRGIDDYQYLKLVREVREQVAKDGYLLTAKSDQNVFKVICDVLNEEKEAKFKWKDFRRRYEELVVKEGKAVVDESEKLENDTMKTFQTHFCVQCGIFCCLIHPMSKPEIKPEPEVQEIHDNSDSSDASSFSKASTGKSMKRLSFNPAYAAKAISNHYKPCNCDGPCIDGSCPCLKVSNYCENLCKCLSSVCLNHYGGCRCKGRCVTNQCSCYDGRRECDPEVCKCKISETRDDDQKSCLNVSIQKKWKKPLLLAPSKISGWGVFSKGCIKKDEYIDEYCGEIISEKETERRGKIYDTSGCSYNFTLTEEYVVDSTRMGNKTKFINHSEKPNIYPRTMYVKGDYRIAFYAIRDIEPYEELLFDYKYDKELKKKLLKK